MLVATSSGFAIYRRITLAEIAVLEQQNATYKLAVDEQSKTIETMQRDAEALAKANKFLNERFAATESEFVSDVYRIDGIDFGDIDGLQQRINDEFQRSIEDLRNATAK
ncbi:hypothetical protein SJ05684_c21500 [Sinorhizobium sojae CCBAU 05684]|uniref:Uncharacterized protein n=1 Tax=Sinorhizobium sojae CCBAU 05684 TaxID=716928 RepID=A0A249PCE6_9HYPH|nr:hypothetical protein SJ05684_c21500 [Sinorhizobium sojae CCBAU 05684]